MELLNLDNIPFTVINRKNLYYKKYRYKLSILRDFTKNSGNTYNLYTFMYNIKRSDYMENKDFKIVGFDIYTNEELFVELYNRLRKFKNFTIEGYKIGQVTIVEETMYIKREPKYKYRVYLNNNNYKDLQFSNDISVYLIEKYKDEVKPSYAFTRELLWHLDYKKNPIYGLYIRNGYYVDIKDEKRYVHFNLMFGEVISKRYKLEKIK
jgi:hypothetical protein